MITDFDKIVKEWSYRVHNSKPNPQNSTHQYQLTQILVEYGWPYQAIDELIQNLNEIDIVKNKKSGNVYPVRTHNPDTQDLIKKDASKDDIEKVKKDKDDKPSGSDKEDNKLNFKQDRDKIVKGLVSPPGTGGSAIGEMYGGISVEESYSNPNMTEEQFVDKHFEDVRNSPMSKGMSDKDIRKWLAIAHRTGQNEIKELKNNKKYRFEEKQNPPYPLAVMDPVNDKANSKQQLIDFFDEKLEQAKKDNNQEAIKHYERQLRFIKSRKDSDTGVLYETEEGEIGFKHTSNKKSFTDPVFNSTIVARGAVMKTASENVSTTYDYTPEQQKQISKNIEDVTNRGAKLVERAGLGPGEAIRQNIEDERDFSKRNKVGKLFKNFDGGMQGRKNYLIDIQNEIESNKGVGKKVKDYLDEKGIEPPYTEDDIAAAVIGIAKAGDNTGAIRKLVVKLSDNVKKSREVYERIKSQNPDKSDDEIKQMTLDTLNGYKTREGNDSPEKFDIDTLEGMLSEDMDWIENVGAETRDAMNVAHKQIVGDLDESDKKWREDNPDTPPSPPDNGPNTQSYIAAYMKQMHWDRYIYGDEEDIGDMSIDGYNVNSQTIRECLADLSGFEGSVDSSEDRQKLFSHLRKTLRPDSESGSISFNSQKDNKSIEIGKEQYRTKGVGNNSVLGNFGKDLQKCMKGKVVK